MVGSGVRLSIATPPPHAKPSSPKIDILLYTYKRIICVSILYIYIHIHKSQCVYIYIYIYILWTVPICAVFNITCGVVEY